MARERREIDSQYGKGSIHVIVCDACRQAQAVDDTYIVPERWYRLWTAGDSPGRTRERDFCSTDCIVCTLVPDIYDTDPVKVTAAISNLKRIVTSLGT